jgi:peptidoglycan/LPS O-acetylase OafA/YrhL
MITEHNNFNALRLIAAFAVLFSHTFPLTFGSDQFEPLYRLTAGQTTVGTTAVAVFFVISGFLITRSFEHGGPSWQGVFRFIVARAVRILPALFVVLALLAFAIGPILSLLSIAEYFRNPEVFSFVGVNLSLLTFRDGLPGVLTNNPFPDSIDGSLWTLKYEARCYFLVLALGVLRALNRRVVGILFVAALSAVLLQFDRFWLWELGAFFLGGAFLYLRPLPLNGRVALLSIAAIIGSWLVGGYNIVAPIFGSYLVVWLALSPTVRLPNLAKYGDFSYGVYVYAFPVQQIVTMTMGANATWYWTGLISAPITLLLGFLSWNLVERPALALRGRSSRPVIESSLVTTRPDLQTGS